MLAYLAFFPKRALTASGRLLFFFFSVFSDSDSRARIWNVGSLWRGDEVDG